MYDKCQSRGAVRRFVTDDENDDNYITIEEYYRRQRKS
jgi:hypothetical protein